MKLTVEGWLAVLVICIYLSAVAVEFSYFATTVAPCVCRDGTSTRAVNFFCEKLTIFGFKKISFFPYSR